VKLKIVILSVIGFCIMLQLGCATVGGNFQFKGPESIQIGKTTKSELMSNYGKPFRVGYDNGDTKWTYGYYQYRIFGSSDTKDLIITFNNKGVVSNYAYSSSDAQEVDLQTK
jgi:hypothetical protein